ncbi:MAG: 4'-phosphopantetheinyl transferase superfamily protein [Lachnospiraceae bacterium]|nr:4'-phosphopantetheinyl transferase superfamily protein [Lachnospiraceae bacterium]
MITAYYIQKNIETIDEDMLVKMLPALPDERREKAMRYKIHEGKVLCALSWLLLEHLIKKEDIHHGPFTITTGKYEKPYVRDDSFFFNISHTSGAVLAAAGFSPLGADIQKIMEKDYGPVAKRFLKPKEYSLITRSPEPQKEFARLWTLKESYTKYTGEGISALENVPDLSSFGKAGGRLSNGPSFLTEEGDGLFISICSNDAMKIMEIGLDEVLNHL